MENLIDAVKAHATANYNKNGWDFVLECFSDDQIKDIIGEARTIDGAIAKMREEIKWRHEMRLDQAY
tara:strand:- start:260 stop:460 length:201 start_codon:yes stop_codon:yes gene_type:complete